MKKSLFWSMIVFMLVAIVGLSACSKDDDDDNNNSKSSVITKTTWNWSNSSGDENLTIVFNSNGTGNWSYFEVRSSGRIDSFSGDLTWTETSSKKGMLIMRGIDDSFSASGKDESTIFYYIIAENKMYLYDRADYSHLEFTLTKQ